MISAIKTIRLKNIQSHKDVLIELPETGLVVFCGDNSNGKSVVRKLLEDIVLNKITQLSNRKDMINVNESAGSIEITKYDGTSLFLNLNLEASRTYVTLKRADGTEVTRYLSDKTIPELIDEFGLHVNRNRGISLNIYDSDNPTLFFKTPHVVNGDILESAFTDSEATRKIQILHDVYQNGLLTKRKYADNIRVHKAAMDSLIMYDVEKETATMEQLQKCYAVLSNIYIPELLEVPEIPEVLFINLPEVKLHDLKFPLIVALPPVSLYNLEKLGNEIITLEEGVCPICGRPFSSHPTYTKGTQTSTR